MKQLRVSLIVKCAGLLFVPSFPDRVSTWRGGLQWVGIPNVQQIDDVHLSLERMRKQEVEDMKVFLTMGNHIYALLSLQVIMRFSKYILDMFNTSN